MQHHAANERFQNKLFWSLQMTKFAHEAFVELVLWEEDKETDSDSNRQNKEGISTEEFERYKGD